MGEFDKVAKSQTDIALAYRKAIWQPWLRLSIVKPPRPSFREIDAATLPNAAAPSNTLPKHLIVHVCDWHYVSRESFAADLRSSGKNFSDEEIGQLYAEHLNEVEAVQAEQLENLRALVKQHHLKHIWVEGLTPDDMPGFRAIVEVLKNSNARPSVTSANRSTWATCHFWRTL